MPHTNDLRVLPSVPDVAHRAEETFKRSVLVSGQPLRTGYDDGL